VFDISFPTAVDRFITLWEMAGEVMTDPILSEASKALKEGSGMAQGQDATAIFEANKELWSLHELMAHRLFQILVGAHKGRVYGV
jgi:xylose isomerase